MTSLADRQRIVCDLQEACRHGARLHKACEVVGVSLNCWYRWQRSGTAVPDRRAELSRSSPANKLSLQERCDILAVCNSKRFSRLPPSQIVPVLADEGCYLASESSFYRVLREAGQTCRRGRSALPKTKAKPTSYTAKAPNQIWSWDITWLPSLVKGQFYKLYLVEDIFSRFPVGYEVYEEETGQLAADLIQRSMLTQRCAASPLVLHSDNGPAMKSYTLKAKLEALGITASHSRPRVSNDNPYSESLFRTLKYCPQWPATGFTSLEQAREWVERFIHWYSYEHRHSGIRFVTPAQRHQGQDKALLKKRDKVYQMAYQAHPERWSRSTRNWSWINQVQLNPDRDLSRKITNSRVAA